MLPIFAFKRRSQFFVKELAIDDLPLLERIHSCFSTHFGVLIDFNFLNSFLKLNFPDLTCKSKTFLLEIATMSKEERRAAEWNNKEFSRFPQNPNNLKLPQIAFSMQDFTLF